MKKKSKQKNEKNGQKNSPLVLGGLMSEL